MRKFRKEKISVLDEPIAKVLTDMNAFGPDSPEYPKLVDHLERLMTLKAQETAKRRISPDTMAIVGGNLLGIVIIVAYEQKHVLVSKATAMIIRPKGDNI